MSTTVKESMIGNVRAIRAKFHRSTARNDADPAKGLIVKYENPRNGPPPTYSRAAVGDRYYAID